MTKENVGTSNELFDRLLLQKVLGRKPRECNETSWDALHHDHVISKLSASFSPKAGIMVSHQAQEGSPVPGLGGFANDYYLVHLTPDDIEPFGGRKIVGEECFEQSRTRYHLRSDDIVVFQADKPQILTNPLAVFSEPEFAGLTLMIKKQAYHKLGEGLLDRLLDVDKAMDIFDFRPKRKLTQCKAAYTHNSLEKDMVKAVVQNAGLDAGDVFLRAKKAVLNGQFEVAALINNIGSELFPEMGFRNRAAMEAANEPPAERGR